MIKAKVLLFLCGWYFLRNIPKHFLIFTLLCICLCMLLKVRQMPHTLQSTSTSLIPGTDEEFINECKAADIQSFNVIYQLLCYQKKAWTGENYAYILARYLRYGCWCGGYHGAGEPVDAIDECCKAHDKCFLDARLVSGHSGMDAFMAFYSFTCHKNVVTCNDTCGLGRRLCECDKIFAACIAPVDGQWRFDNLFRISCWL